MQASNKNTLPNWLNWYLKCGGPGLILGTILCLGAFFTNSVPDPSFPWAKLPSSWLLPFEQPQIEHWPVTYTIGIWLWIIFFPTLFLIGYKHLGNSHQTGLNIWLIILPLLAMLAWTTYCRFFWPKLYPPTWNAPSYTIICWFYCASYNPFWSNLAYGFTILGFFASFLAYRGSKNAPLLLVAFGILAFPLGIPTLYEGYRRYKQHTRRITPNPD